MSETNDHRRIIASLGAEERAGLLARSNVPGLIHLAGHAGAIVLMAALIALEVPGWWLLLPVQGIFIVFLFTTLHETIHETAFRAAWINRAVSAVAGFLLILPPQWLRYFHFAHHRFTHDPERDPELASPKPETVGRYLLYLSGIPVWWSQGRWLVTHAIGGKTDEFVPERGRGKVRREAVTYLALYAAIAAASVAAGSALLLKIWIVPMVLGQPFLRAYLLAEHTRCPHVANMLVNSRTTFTTSLVRFLAWNMPYHAEHHAYPAVPFHKLPRFHQIVRDHLAITERGYVRFHRKLAGDIAAGRGL